MGIKEQIAFSEISIDKINKVTGMDITFVTDTDLDTEALALLKELGLPFKKNDDIEKQREEQLEKARKERRREAEETARAEAAARREAGLPLQRSGPSHLAAAAGRGRARASRSARLRSGPRARSAAFYTRPADACCTCEKLAG